MTDWELSTYEQEIIERLDRGEIVYLESGAVCTMITGYEDDECCGGTAFITIACVYPRKINLRDYDGADTEEFNGRLFLHVW